jgi:hypothetical protein
MENVMEVEEVPEFSIGRRSTLIYADKKKKISVVCANQRPFFGLLFVVT